ncbi:MAG: hypothetical protein VB025_12625, partial [Sphaerochaeta sp.]|nr:hypothetical protein [Sphaerochaeta sp.]
MENRCQEELPQDPHWEVMNFFCAHHIDIDNNNEKQATPASTSTSISAKIGTRKKIHIQGEKWAYRAFLKGFVENRCQEELPQNPHRELRKFFCAHQIDI